jgi:hypothetical protein
MQHLTAIGRDIFMPMNLLASIKRYFITSNDRKYIRYADDYTITMKTLIDLMVPYKQAFP